MRHSTRLGLAGDVMLGRGVDRVQEKRPPDAVWGGLRSRLEGLDGFICNLECCLSTRGVPWTETYHPFHFRADPDWAIPALRAIDCRAVTLANNHALDYGPVALRDTLDALDGAGIAVAGAGVDRASAVRPASITVQDVDIALVAVTDNSPEFAATPEGAGVAYVDLEADPEPQVVARAVEQALAADPDLLIGSVHLGPNMVAEPRERYIAFDRWLVDLGVDVVLGHSAHVFQGIERYEGSLIIHDAGDFVDDYAVNPSLRNDRGFLFELRLEDGDVDRLRLIPTEIDEYAVHPASPEAAEWARDRLRTLSAPFGTAFQTAGSNLLLEF